MVEIRSWAIEINGGDLMSFKSPTSQIFSKVTFNFISHKVNVLGTTLDTFSHVRRLGDVRNTCPWYTFPSMVQFSQYTLSLNFLGRKTDCHNKHFQNILQSTSLHSMQV
jgi:hypothetical protein